MQFLHARDGALFFYDEGTAYQCDSAFRLVQTRPCCFCYRQRYPNKVVAVNGQRYGIHSRFGKSELFYLTGLVVSKIADLPEIDSYDALGGLIACYSSQNRTLFAMTETGKIVSAVEQPYFLFLHSFGEVLHAITTNLSVFLVSQQLYMSLARSGLSFSVDNMAMERHDHMIFNALDLLQVVLTFPGLESICRRPPTAALCPQNLWDRFRAKAAKTQQ